MYVVRVNIQSWVVFEGVRIYRQTDSLKTRLRFKVSLCIDEFARDINNILRLVTAY